MLVSTLTRLLVGSGCILNQFEEPVRSLTECAVITVDKKQLKRLCMLARWPFLGSGLRSGEGIHQLTGRVGTKCCEWKAFRGLQVCVREMEGWSVSEWGRGRNGM